MKDTLRVIALFISSIATIIMSQFIPEGTGGATMIYLISLPSLFTLGMIFIIMDYFLIKKLKNIIIRNTVFLLMVSILIGLAIWFYPFA
jgi:hypothetical protein